MLHITSIKDAISTCCLFLRTCISVPRPISPWNGHLRPFALSGMPGTQLCSHGDEGEERRRMRRGCYSESPAQKPQKTQRERKGKCGKIWKETRMIAHWKKRLMRRSVKLTKEGATCSEMAFYEAWRVRCLHVGHLSKCQPSSKWAQSQIITQVIITSWREWHRKSEPSSHTLPRWHASAHMLTPGLLALSNKQLKSICLPHTSKHTSETHRPHRRTCGVQLF